MVEIQGNASTGYVYNNTGPLDLPRDTGTIRAAHQPWCVDCKRKGRELDVDQRCHQCARAVITRAEGAARRAAAEQAAAEAKAAARATATSTTPKPPMEGKQGKPTTRSSAPRTTQTSDVPDRGRTPGRAPGAGSSTHREKNPPTVQETRPETVGGPSEPVENRQPEPAPAAPLPTVAPTAEQILDAQAEHAAELLRSTHDHAHPGVQAARAAVVATVEALHLVVALADSPAAPVTPPAPVAPPATIARPTATPTPPRRTPPRRTPRGDLNEQTIVREYRAGDTAPTIAARHNTTAARVRRIIDRHNVERRDDRALSGGNNRIDPTPELLEELRRAYVDDEATIVDLAAKHGLHRRIVARFLNEAGVTIRPPAHLRGTDLTPEQVAELVDAYRSGVSTADVAARFQIRSTTVRLLVAQAGVEIRSTKGASAQIAERLQELGVTAKQVKAWAFEQGLIDRVGPGLVASALIEKYAAAHRRDNVA